MTTKATLTGEQPTSTSPTEGKVKHGADDASAELKKLLQEFAADTPHEAMHGSYQFKDSDAWSGRDFAKASDGWYAHGGWAVRIEDGKAVEINRCDPKNLAPSTTVI